MRIWVDTERIPRAARDVVKRAGDRIEIPVRFVVTSRDGAASGERSQVQALLLGHSEPGDLVVTEDVEIGPELVRRGVVAIDARGDEYAGPAVATRQALDLLSSVRSYAAGDRGPPPYDERAKRRFAATLDRMLTRLF